MKAREVYVGLLREYLGERRRLLVEERRVEGRVVFADKLVAGSLRYALTGDMERAVEAVKAALRVLRAGVEEEVSAYAE